jgi:hypothetical protein
MRIVHRASVDVTQNNIFNHEGPGALCGGDRCCDADFVGKRMSTSQCSGLQHVLHLMVSMTHELERTNTNRPIKASYNHLAEDKALVY